MASHRVYLLLNSSIVNEKNLEDERKGHPFFTASARKAWPIRAGSVRAEYARVELKKLYPTISLK